MYKPIEDLRYLGKVAQSFHFKKPTNVNVSYLIKIIHNILNNSKHSDFNEQNMSKLLLSLAYLKFTQDSLKEHGIADQLLGLVEQYASNLTDKGIFLTEKGTSNVLWALSSLGYTKSHILDSNIKKCLFDAIYQNKTKITNKGICNVLYTLDKLGYHKSDLIEESIEKPLFDSINQNAEGIFGHYLSNMFRNLLNFGYTSQELRDKGIHESLFDRLYLCLETMTAKDLGSILITLHELGYTRSELKKSNIQKEMLKAIGELGKQTNFKDIYFVLNCTQIMGYRKEHIENTRCQARLLSGLYENANKMDDYEFIVYINLLHRLGYTKSNLDSSLNNLLFDVASSKMKDMSGRALEIYAQELCKFGYSEKDLKKIYRLTQNVSDRYLVNPKSSPEELVKVLYQMVSDLKQHSESKNGEKSEKRTAPKRKSHGSSDDGDSHRENYLRFKFDKMPEDSNNHKQDSGFSFS